MAEKHGPAAVPFHIFFGKKIIWAQTEHRPPVCNAETVITGRSANFIPCFPIIDLFLAVLFVTADMPVVWFYGRLRSD